MRTKNTTVLATSTTSSHPPRDEECRDDDVEPKPDERPQGLTGEAGHSTVTRILGRAATTAAVTSSATPAPTMA